MLKAEGCFLKFQDNKEGKAQDTKGLNFLSESYQALASSIFWPYEID